MCDKALINQSKIVFFAISLSQSVALCYYPSGAFLATILHSFQNSGRTRYGHASFVWALSLAVVGALCAALILCIAKAVAKRIVWLHMYLLAVGNIFLLTCGLMLMANVNRFLHGTPALPMDMITAADNMSIHPQITRLSWSGVRSVMAWCTSRECLTFTPAPIATGIVWLELPSVT